jgi:hypothetical protein
MTSDGEKHSKRAGEPDPGLDPEPYESSRPSQEAVQRGGAEERLLASVGEDPTGDGVEGAQVAAEDGHLPESRSDGERGDDDIELVDQPGQPNMGPPHTAPAPPVPGTRR